MIRPLVVAGAFMLLASCVSCGKKERSLAKLAAPIEVDWRFQKGQWSGRGATEDSGILFVTVAGKPAPHRAHCYAPSPELAADTTPDRFAYRCRPDEVWTAVYLSPSRVFTACTSQLGAGAAPAWANAPQRWSAAGAALLSSCDNRPYDGNISVQLYREAALASDEIAFEFLSATRDTDSSSEWTDAVQKLSPAARDRLRALLITELAKPDVLRPAFCNAVALVGESDPAVRANATFGKACAR